MEEVIDEIRAFYYRLKEEFSKANENMSLERVEFYKKELTIYINFLMNEMKNEASHYNVELYIRKLTRYQSIMDECSQIS